MKKLIIKTSLITLASIIGALVITVGALCLFAPATMAGFFDDVGNDSASVFFYEKQYEKTGDIQDLDKLLVKVYAQKDNKLCEKYAKAMIEHKDFSKLSAQDKEYYYGCYALSLAKNGKFDKAVSVGTQYVEAYGYTKYNPLSVLLSDYIKQDMLENKTKLKGAIEQTSNVSIEQQTFKSNDLNKLS